MIQLIKTFEATTEQLQREAGDAQTNAQELSNQLSTMNEHLQGLEAEQQVNLWNYNFTVL